MLFHSAAFGFSSSFACFFLPPRVRMAGKRTRSAAAMQRRTARRVSVSLETIFLQAAGLPDPRGYVVGMPCTQQQVLGANGLFSQRGLPKRLSCGCAGWFLTRLRVDWRGNVSTSPTTRRARGTDRWVVQRLSRMLHVFWIIGLSDHDPITR